MSRYVVTGAASGIGRALAERLLTDGHSVVAIDRHAAAVPPGCTSLAADLADTASVPALAAAAGRVDGLANVAGIPGTAAAETVLRVNFLAARHLAKAVSSTLQVTQAVVNVSSLAARRPGVDDEVAWHLAAAPDDEVLAFAAQAQLSGSAAYDLSKKLLVLATTLLAADLAPHGVRAVSVSPGPVETPILGDFRTSMGASVDAAAETLGRHATAHEVADVVAFLLSPKASWLNGVDLPLDGGLLALRAASARQGAPA